MPLQMAAEKGNTPEEGDAAAAAVAADGQFYFATRVSDKPNVKMFFELVRNQLLLGASCYWTLSGACAYLCIPRSPLYHLIRVDSCRNLRPNQTCCGVCVRACVRMHAPNPHLFPL